MTEAKKAQTEAQLKAAEEAKSSGLDMIAINTVGNHKPGDAFTAKDQAAYDRFMVLGVAKKA